MTRTAAQIRSHAQKYLIKVERISKAKADHQERLFTIIGMTNKFEMYAQSIETQAHLLYIDRISKCSNLINQKLNTNPISNYLSEVTVPVKNSRPHGFELPIPKKISKTEECE